VPGARLHGRAFRLTGPGAFEAVFREGRRSEGLHVQLVAAAAARTPGRIGYVIGRKSLPRAVDRNRLRRRLREIVRPLRPALAAYDVILRVKKVANLLELDAAVAEAASLLAGLLAAGR
jgi:ribonuclease P protein component